MPGGPKTPTWAIFFAFGPRGRGQSGPMNTVIAVPILVVFGILAALGLVWGAPIFAIPFLVLALLVGGAWMFAMRARQRGDIKNELYKAKAQKTDFTAEDRETLTHR